MSGRPLIVTADEAVLDELLRVAAAANVDVDHSPDPTRAAWRAASLVLIDTDRVAVVLAQRLPRRAGVVAVGRAEPALVDWAPCIALGVQDTVRLGGADEVLVGLLADAVTGGPGDGRSIAVLGACGGAGASVFAAALAAAADRRGRRVLLLDLDRWGPGLDVVLGVEESAGLTWSNVAAPSGRLPATTLHDSLPRAPVGQGRISLLAHDRHPRGELDPGVVEVVTRAARQAGDLLVADLPRDLDAAAEPVLEAADLVLVVTPADLRGCFAGVRMLHRLHALGVDPKLVVRGPSPGGIGADDLADVLGAPVLVRMRPQPHLARDLESGRVPGADRGGPLARAAAAVLARLDGAPPPDGITEGEPM